MPTTPSLNLPYPAPSDAPAGPAAFQQLAEAVDSAHPAVSVLSLAAAMTVTSSTPAAIPDLTTTITAPTSPQTYAVTLHADAQQLGTSGTLVLDLLVGASPLPQQAPIALPTGGRSPMTRTWIVTGLSATTVLTPRAYLAATSSPGYRLNALHTTLTVVRVR